MKSKFQKIIENSTFEMKISVISLIFSISLGYLVLNTDFLEVLEDFEDIRQSDVVGSISTIYALITAFILVTEWNNYNETSNSYAKEAEALMHLWSFIDFLDDDDISRGMQYALSAYIDRAINDEFIRLKRGKKVFIPSVEFTRILRLLDAINFDDPRDATAFNAIIGAFKDLSHARTQRIEQSLNQIPGIIKVFYLFASLIFWLTYLIEIFPDHRLYYLILIMVTLVVILAYTIIFDLDKPLQGLLRISLENYNVCKMYIQETDHVS